MTLQEQSPRVIVYVDLETKLIEPPLSLPVSPLKSVLLPCLCLRDHGYMLGSRITSTAGPPSPARSSLRIAGHRLSVRLYAFSAPPRAAILDASRGALSLHIWSLVRGDPGRVLDHDM
nr:hypothetical protein CFP56_00194 [Quercus suber]